MNARTAHAPVVRLVKTASPESTADEPVTELRVVVELRGATDLTLSQLFRSLGDAAADHEARVEPEAAPLAVGTDGLVVDPVSRIVSVDGHVVHFTFMEFELLARLVAAPGRAFSRGQLLEELWNTTFGGDRTVDVHVGRIRRKIGRFGHQLEAVPRVGYRWSVPARATRSVEVPAQRANAALVRAAAV